jgi:tetratricopeptide (TPR) repeat protein
MRLPRRVGAAPAPTVLVLAVAVALASLAALAAPARAQTPPGPITGEAADDYRKGATAYDLGEYQPALEAFKDAYRLVQDPVLLFNIAQCHRKLGQVAEALSFYRSYLRRAPQAEHRAEVLRHIEEMERLAAQKPAAASPAVPPPGDRSADGEGGGAPLAPSGSSMAAAPAPPPAASATSPFAASAPVSIGVTAAPEASAVGHRRRTLAVVAGGVGLAGLAVGSVLALSARSSYDSAAARCPDHVCASLADKMQGDDARRLGNIATAFSVGGAAVAVAGVILWLTAPEDSRARGLAAAPSAGPSYAGMTLTGRFQ